MESCFAVVVERTWLLLYLSLRPAEPLLLRRRWCRLMMHLVLRFCLSDQADGLLDSDDDGPGLLTLCRRPDGEHRLGVVQERPPFIQRLMSEAWPEDGGLCMYWVKKGVVIVRTGVLVVKFYFHKIGLSCWLRSRLLLAADRRLSWGASARLGGEAAISIWVWRSMFLNV